MAFAREFQPDIYGPVLGNATVTLRSPSGAFASVYDEVEVLVSLGTAITAVRPIISYYVLCDV